MPRCTARRTLKRRRDSDHFKWTSDGRAIAFVDPEGTNCRRLAVSRRQTRTDIVLFTGLNGGTR